MAQSHGTEGEPVTRRHPHPGWISEITGVDQGAPDGDTGIGDDRHDHRIPALEQELGVQHLDPAATEGNGNGRRGDGGRMPDPRPDPDGPPQPNGKSGGGGSGSSFEAPGPQFMPPEMAQPLGDLSIRGINGQTY
jgi:hypothetical protein